MSDYTNVLTPVGRLVSGHPLIGRDKDFNGNLMTFKSGANIGQPRKEYYVGVAIPKNSPGWPALHAEILKASAAAFPILFPGGVCANPKFSFKITDGDSLEQDAKGTIINTKPGYAGNWVLGFSGSRPVMCFKKLSTGTVQITEVGDIKRGDYVQIDGSITSNNTPLKPGIFFNHSALLLNSQGEALGFNPDKAFADCPVTSNVPASDAPAAPAVTPTGATPATPAPSSITPATDFTAGPPAPPVQALPTVEKYIYNGVTYTREQLAGWSEAQINALPKA